MKNMPIIIISLFLVFCAAEIALAGESRTLTVSIIIPAIPGVNAPPFDVKEPLKDQGKTNTSQEKSSEAIQQALQQANNQNNASFIVEERKAQVALKDGEKSEQTVKTIYSR